MERILRRPVKAGFRNLNGRRGEENKSYEEPKVGESRGGPIWTGPGTIPRQLSPRTQRKRGEELEKNLRRPYMDRLRNFDSGRRMKNKSVDKRDKEQRKGESRGENGRAPE